MIALIADRLAGARGAGDQEVRHLRQVRDDRRPSRSSPSVTGSSRSSADHCSCLQQLAQRHHARLRVRHLDAHHVPPGNAGHADRARAHLERQVVGEVDQPVHLDARGRSRTPYCVTTGPVVRPATSPSTLNVAPASPRAAPAARRARLRRHRCPWCAGPRAAPRSQTGPRSFSPGARRGSGFFGGRPLAACRHPSRRPSPPSRPDSSRPGRDPPRAARAPPRRLPLAFRLLALRRERAWRALRLVGLALQPLQRVPGERGQGERAERQEARQHRAGHADSLGDLDREEAGEPRPPSGRGTDPCRGRPR